MAVRALLLATLLLPATARAEQLILATTTSVRDTGIRPERLEVDVGRGEGLPIGKGVVRTVVSDGVAATLGVAWAGLELRTHLLAGRGLARTLRPGDSVTLSVRPEDVHLLPRG